MTDRKLNIVVYNKSPRQRFCRVSYLKLFLTLEKIVIRHNF